MVYQVPKGALQEDDYAITSQDLVDGLVRSSGAARVLGLSLNETIAVLTVMREATGRTGREVGNATNSILAFMQRDVALNAFAREGIAVWADEAQTKFRNFIDIFDEVASRWQSGALTEASMNMFTEAAEQAGLYSEEMAELSGAQKEFNDLQQRDISQAMAGIYRRNYLLALLQNWGKIQEVLNSQLEASGYSMKENERTMETLEAQYRSLKTAAQELAVELGDAGLLGELKGLVDGTKDLITWFNDLDPVMRNMLINFVEVTVAARILGAVVKMTGINNAASLLSGWAVSATKATATTRVFTSAVTGLGTGLLNTGKGLVGFFGGPWGLAITAATAGIITLVNHHRNAVAQEQQNIESAKTLSEEYNKLSDKLDSLKEGTDEYSETNKELQDKMNAIADIMPDVVSKWDALGNAIEINNYKLRENIKLAKEATEANYGQALSSALRQKQVIEEQISKAGPSTQTEQPESNWRFSVSPNGVLLNPTYEQMSELRTRRTELDDEIKKYSELIAKDSGGDPKDRIIEELTKNKEEEDNRYVGGTPTPTTSAAPTLREQTSDTIAQLEQYADAQMTINDAIQREIDISEARVNYYKRTDSALQDQINMLTLYREKQEGLSVEADLLREAITNLEAKQKNLDTTTEEGKDAFDQIGQEVEKLKDRVTGLSTEWMKLQIATEDAVAEYIQKAREIESELEQSTLESQYEKAIQTLSDLKEAANEASEARIQSLQDELDALEEENDLLEEQQAIEEKRQALAEARQKLANIQAEKNTRIFQNGRWEYVADPQKVKDAQKEVKDAQEALNEAREEREEKSQKRRLQKQIEAARKEQEEQDKAYDTQIKEQEEYWKQRLEDNEKEWTKLLTSEQIQLDTFNAITRDGIQEALRKWQRYYERVKAIQAETGGAPSGDTSQPPSYDTGGPIYSDQFAKLHAEEYVLNASNVAAMGGFKGVERLIAAVKLPSLSPAVGNSYSTNQTYYTSDRRISGINVNLPHVYDASGFIRNLRQLSVS